MRTRNRKRNTVPVALWTVALLVITCVGAATFFVPDETLVIKRLAADGNFHRLLETVTEKIGREPSDAELIEHAAREFAKHRWDETATQAMQALAANVSDVEVGFAALSKIEGEIPADLAPSLYGEMAKRALGETKPALAAKIYRRMSEISGMSERLAIDIVTALRASTQPAAALATLTEFNEAIGGELPEPLRQLQYDLALEAGAGDIAFAIALANYEKNKGKTPSSQLAALDMLITAATHAKCTDRVLPICDDYLANTTAGRMTLLEILERCSNDPGFHDEEFQQIASKAAVFCGWNNMPDKGFDYFLKLAALGDTAALDHCIAQRKPLLRESELVTVLDRFVPTEGKPAYTLIAAQIHAKQTDYAVADKFYRMHLAAHPNDAATWTELGGMWDATSEFDLALAAYRRGAAANPDEPLLQDRIARTLISMGDFEGALDLYASMEEFDRKVLSRYLSLANNLGDNRGSNDALRKWFKLPGEHRPIDYTRLASSYRLLGENEHMIAVYRRGISAFPDNREMKIELARELSRLSRHRDVMSLIGSSGLRNDPEGVSLHLSSALASKRSEAGLAFCGSDAEHRMHLPISARLPLAEIYFQTGSISKSNQLYSSIPKSEMPALTQAMIAFRTGAHSEAEKLLRDHLASNSKDHQGWSFLASVYQAQRKKTEAKAAYQRALALLTAEMKRR